MDDEIEFKFSPSYILLTSIWPLLFIYMSIDGFYSEENIVLFIMAAISSYIVLPNLIKMLFGVPAIKLNSDELINNVSGINLNWEDINGFSVTNGYRLDFLIIELNTTKYLKNSALQRMLNYLLNTSDYDFRINITAVKGRNSEILSTIRNYRYDKVYKSVTSPLSKTAPDTAP